MGINLLTQFCLKFKTLPYQTCIKFSPPDSVGSSSAAPRPSNSHVYSLDNEADGPQTEYINIQDDQNYENVKSPPKRHRSSKQSVQEDPNNTQSYIEVWR